MVVSCKQKLRGNDLFDNEKLEEKIDKIYNRHYLEVYRFLVCFSGNQNDAEDLTHSFVK